MKLLSKGHAMLYSNIAGRAICDFPIRNRQTFAGAYGQGGHAGSGFGAGGLLGQIGEPVALNFVLQGAAADAEGLGGFFAVGGDFEQGLANELGLDLGDCHAGLDGDGVRFTPALVHGGWQII